MHLPASLHRFDAPVVRQFVKFGIVGASNTILTFVIYSVAVVIGVHYAIALVLGYIVGSLNSYLLNRHWTFRAGHLAHAKVGTRFAVVQVCAIAANEGLLYLLVHHAGFDSSHKKILAQAILTIPVLAVTFFINRYWAFASPPEPKPPPPSS